MTTFPTNLDTLTNPASGDALNNPSHADQHINANDAIEALEAKVGVDASAVNTTHDFKLSGVATGDKAVSKTGIETLTNKTLTSPVINLSSNATGDTYYRAGDGTLGRLAIGSSTNILQVSSGGVPEWVANPNATDASTSTKGITKLSVAPASATNPIAVGDNDTRIPGYKSGTTTYDLSASGTTTIAHGLGKIPSVVRITGMSIETGLNVAYAVYTASTQSSVFGFSSNDGSATEIAGNSFRFMSNSNWATIYTTGVITVDATNITITWTETGSNSGTAYLTWEAQ